MSTSRTWRWIDEVPNPWGLSPGQCEAIQMTCDGWTAKRAARKLGISHKTVEGQWNTVKKKMKAATLIQAALMWDRFKRSKT